MILHINQHVLKVMGCLVILLGVLKLKVFFIDGHLTFGIFLKVNFSLKASTDKQVTYAKYWKPVW